MGRTEGEVVVVVVGGGGGGGGATEGEKGACVAVDSAAAVGRGGGGGEVVFIGIDDGLATVHVAVIVEAVVEEDEGAVESGFSDRL